jgi:hypothetical protein
MYFQLANGLLFLMCSKFRLFLPLSWAIFGTGCTFRSTFSGHTAGKFCI